MELTIVEQTIAQSRTTRDRNGDPCRTGNGIRHQAVTVEWIEGNGWTILLEDGTVHIRETPAAALHLIRRAAARGNRGLTLTRIRWQGVPDGWEPPSRD